jgi:hypothetical protein
MLVAEDRSQSARVASYSVIARWQGTGRQQARSTMSAGLGLVRCSCERTIDSLITKTLEAS